LIFPKIVSLLLRFWVGDILLQFTMGFIDRLPASLQSKSPKKLPWLWKLLFFGGASANCILGFVKQFAEKFEVFIHISVHDENVVVDIYYHVFFVPRQQIFCTMTV